MKKSNANSCFTLGLISAPLDAEDLDYEPEGIESEPNIDSTSVANAKIGGVADNNRLISNGFNSNNFGNFRRNYMRHIDVAEGSFRKRYAPHIQNDICSESDTPTFLDSESEDETEMPDSIVASDLMNLNEPSPAGTESYSGDDSRLSSTPYDSDFGDGCYSSRDVSSDNAMFPSRQAYQGSTESGITDDPSLHSGMDDENSRCSKGSITEYVNPVPAQPTEKDVVIPPPNPLNFSITLTQNSRRIVVGTAKRKKPWCAKVDEPSFKLMSTDEIIKFVPSTCNEDFVSDASTHSGSSSFKIPLKRPPTRPKPALFTVTVSEQGERGVSAEHPMTRNESEDIISMSASSFVPEPEEVTKDEPCSPTKDDLQPGASSFKMPFKRPPTRPKSALFTVTVSEQGERGVSTEHPMILNESEDIISISASSFVLEPEDVTKDEPCSPLLDDLQPLPQPVDFNGKVQGWFETMEVTEPSPVVNVSSLQDRIMESASAQPGKPRRRVPEIYRGLCYRRLFPFPGTDCVRWNCRLIHSVRDLPEHRWLEMARLAESDLLGAYEFGKQYDPFYEHVFEKFVDVFASKGMIKSAVDVVDHVFGKNMSRYYKTRSLEVVLSGLQKCELTFHDAVETVLVQIGLSKYPDLGDLLISLIASAPDLCVNWPIVRRLVVAGHKMETTVATKLLSNLARQPVDAQACADVSRILAKFNFVDPRQIPADVLAAFEAAAAPQNRIPPSPEPRPVTFSAPEAERADVEHNLDVDERVTPSNPSVAFDNSMKCTSSSSNTSNHDETSRGSSPAFVYNHEGSVYDPIVDYEPSKKRQRRDAGSSAERLLLVEKPPEHPKFGCPSFDPAYRFNVSLHNLYTRETSCVDVDEDDVLRLNNAVQDGDGRVFLDLLDKYKGPLTVQNFVTMTLAHLKGVKQLAAKKYEDLLSSIEKELPTYFADRDVRAVLEVVTMNLLFELEGTIAQCRDAQLLLERFTDWDSLVTSRVFTNRMRVSLIGRYLFIAKLLAHWRPELTYEILICPTFHLLEPCERWPAQPTDPLDQILRSDLQARNITLKKFLKVGYLKNAQVVMELYRTVVVKKADVWRFDVKPFFDPMMVVLINQSHSLALKQILPDIDALSGLMLKDTLRGYVCALLNNKNNSVNESELYGVYEKCVQRGIYQSMVKGEKLHYVVQVKTDMLNCEIDLIIAYYFFKLREGGDLPPGKAPLSFNINLPGSDMSTRIDFLKNVARSSEEINSVVRCRLWSMCSVDANYVSPTQVNVSNQELVKYLQNEGTS